jgi:GGDEF domain-containing protein
LRAITEASGSAPTIVGAGVARFEEIAASSDEMLTLFDLAKTLTPSMGVQDGAELIAKHLRRLVPSSACVFYMYDADADELVATHASGEHATHIKGLRVPRGQRLSGWVAANLQTIRNSDPVLDLGESARAMTPRPRSCLATPMHAGKTLVGVLSLYSSKKDAYSEDHQRIIEVVARQVSAAMLEAQNAERARAQSLKDETTGLPNLRHLVEFIQAELSEGDQRHAFCLITLRFEVPPTADLDRVTDAVVDGTRRSLRPADLIFRTAQAEFVALLLNTERATGNALALRVKSALDALRGESKINACSVGVASGPLEATDADQLLAISRERCARELGGRIPPPAIH